MFIRQFITCPVCKGKKVVEKTKEEVKRYNRMYFPRKPCPRCNGTGIIFDKGGGK